MSEFDPLATEYKALLDRSVAFSRSESSFFADHKARLIAAIMGDGFAGTILDYGCGTGLLSASLRSTLPHAIIHGYDLSVESLRMVSPALRACGIFTSVEADLAQRYDLIVMANVLHHVPREERQALISRLTKRMGTNGRLIILEHNPANPLTRWVVKHSSLDRNAVLLSPQEALSYLNGAFHAIHRQYVMFFPAPLKWLNWLEPHLSWCPLGAQYTVIGQRRSGSVFLPS